MGPEIRASYTKLALRTFRTRMPTRWDALRDEIGPEVFATLRAAGPVAWLPAAVHARVADGSYQVLGSATAREAWRDVMLDAFDRVLLRPLVSGALAIYGRKPSSIMRMTPQGWSLAWRGCGSAAMQDRGNDEAWMVFEGLPRVLTDSAIVDTFVANCDAALAYVHCRGVATARKAQLAAGKLTIEVRWHSE